MQADAEQASRHAYSLYTLATTASLLACNRAKQSKQRYCSSYGRVQPAVHLYGTAGTPTLVSIRASPAQHRQTSTIQYASIIICRFIGPRAVVVVDAGVGRGDAGGVADRGRGQG